MGGGSFPGNIASTAFLATGVGIVAFSMLSISKHTAARKTKAPMAVVASWFLFVAYVLMLHKSMMERGDSGFHWIVAIAIAFVLLTGAHTAVVTRHEPREPALLAKPPSVQPSASSSPSQSSASSLAFSHTVESARKKVVLSELLRPTTGKSVSWLQAASITGFAEVLRNGIKSAVRAAEITDTNWKIHFSALNEAGTNIFWFKIAPSIIMDKQASIFDDSELLPGYTPQNNKMWKVIKSISTYPLLVPQDKYDFQAIGNIIDNVALFDSMWDELIALAQHLFIVDERYRGQLCHIFTDGTSAGKLHVHLKPASEYPRYKI